MWNVILIVIEIKTITNINTSINIIPATTTDTIWWPFIGVLNSFFYQALQGRDNYPHYTCKGSWGSERLNNVCKITQLVSDQVKNWI